MNDFTGKMTAGIGASALLLGGCASDAPKQVVPAYGDPAKAKVIKHSPDPGIESAAQKMAKRGLEFSEGLEAQEKSKAKLRAKDKSENQITKTSLENNKPETKTAIIKALGAKGLNDIFGMDKLLAKKNTKPLDGFIKVQSHNVDATFVPARVSPPFNKMNFGPRWIDDSPDIIPEGSSVDSGNNLKANPSSRARQLSFMNFVKNAQGKFVARQHAPTKPNEDKPNQAGRVGYFLLHNGHGSGVNEIDRASLRKWSEKQEMRRTMVQNFIVDLQYNKIADLDELLSKLRNITQYEASTIYTAIKDEMQKAFDNKDTKVQDALVPLLNKMSKIDYELALAASPKDSSAISYNKAKAFDDLQKNIKALVSDPTNLVTIDEINQLIEGSGHQMTRAEEKEISLLLNSEAAKVYSRPAGQDQSSIDHHEGRIRNLQGLAWEYELQLSMHDKDPKNTLRSKSGQIRRAGRYPVHMPGFKAARSGLRGRKGVPVAKQKIK